MNKKTIYATDVYFFTTRVFSYLTMSQFDQKLGLIIFLTPSCKFLPQTLELETNQAETDVPSEAKIKNETKTRAVPAGR